MQPQTVIAIDVGGSTLKSGLVQKGQVQGQVRLTPVDSQAEADVILNLLSDLIRSHSDQALDIAFGFPGPFDYRRGICKMEGVAKYASLFNLNLRDELQQRLGERRIVFRNDAEAAILGEALFGSVRQFKRVMGLSLGSGCGSAFLVDGVPQREGRGVPPDGWVYPLKYEGEMADELFSIRGLRRRLEQVGFTGTIPEAAEAACQGNLDVMEVWMGFGLDLGRFSAPLARDFAADAILLVGGISGASDLFTPHMEGNVPILLGQLGRAAALLGAAYPLFLEPA